MIKFKSYKSFFLLCLLFFPFGKSFGQTGFSKINKDILFRTIKHDSSEARYFMVATFVNYCSGLYDIPNYLKMLDSITQGQTRFFICQSSHGESDRGEALRKALKRVHLGEKYIYLIDNKTYKTNKKDERKQGQKFRDDICPACQYSITSGTYYVIFNNEGIIMYSGYVLKPKQMAAILTCNK